MSNVVALIRTKNSKEEIKKSISSIIGLIDYKNKNTLNYVAIKPNLCYYWNAATGYTTDPIVVAGIIDNIREMYGKDIPIRVVESDATAMRVKYAFQMLGYKKLADEKNIELCNLSEDKVVKKKLM